MGWSTPHINPPPCCFSSTWGYQMCQAQFGMGQIQINILFQRATGESPCWVSKKNTLGFICIGPSALTMLYVLALDLNSHLWLHWYNTPGLVSPSWKGIKLDLWQLEMQITAHKKYMQHFLSTGTHAHTHTNKHKLYPIWSELVYKFCLLICFTLYFWHQDYIL